MAIEDDLVKQLFRALLSGTDYRAFWEMVKSQSNVALTHNYPMSMSPYSRAHGVPASR